MCGRFDGLTFLTRWAAARALLSKTTSRQQQPYHGHNDTEQKPQPHERHSNDSSQQTPMQLKHTNEYDVLATYLLDMYLIAWNFHCFSRGAKKLQKSPPYYYVGAFLLTNTTGRGSLIYQSVLVTASLAICIGNANCISRNPSFSSIYDRCQQSVCTSGEHPTVQVQGRSKCTISCG